ncbi:SsrA-binding protein SmpB [bacterium]|nr:SsrA-binding protein SmpB [bacterium]
MKIFSLNRKARYEFQILKRYQAGIALLGQEVKAIREGKISLNEAFCLLKEKGLYLINAHIGQYSKSGEKLDPYRERPLLLTQKEIAEIRKELQQRKGLSLIPLKIFDKKGWIKIEIALAKKKKKKDKKEALKQKAIQKEIDQEVKQHL